MEIGRPEEAAQPSGARGPRTRFRRTLLGRRSRPGRKRAFQRTLCPDAADFHSVVTKIVPITTTRTVPGGKSRPSRRAPLRHHFRIRRPLPLTHTPHHCRHPNRHVDRDPARRDCHSHGHARTLLARRRASLNFCSVTTTDTTFTSTATLTCEWPGPTALSATSPAARLHLASDHFLRQRVAEV